MGTNFYLVKEPFDRLHIGKSGPGWNFALHVTETITSINDWILAFSIVEGSRIEDEHENTYTVDEMLKIITGRTYQSSGPLKRHSYRLPNPDEDLTGLTCTYDYIPGNFS